jgi:uncharacterized protein (UPF0548 family)
MFTLREPSAGRMAGVVARQEPRELTYAEHGATASRFPAGYRHDRWLADLGRYDEASFARLSEGLLNWQAQLGAGMTVCPLETARPGLTFALSIRLGPATGRLAGYVTAAGRVVYLTDEPGRRGFAYGTLPGHPEQGEEAFHVIRDGCRMVLEVTAFSRPRHPLARAGAPVARAVQRRINAAYLASMTRFAAAIPSGGNAQTEIGPN